jgi:hypothetical protein
MYIDQKLIEEWCADWVKTDTSIDVIIKRATEWEATGRITYGRHIAHKAAEGSSHE